MFWSWVSTTCQSRDNAPSGWFRVAYSTLTFPQLIGCCSDTVELSNLLLCFKWEFMGSSENKMESACIRFFPYMEDVPGSQTLQFCSVTKGICRWFALSSFAPSESSDHVGKGGWTNTRLTFLCMLTSSFRTSTVTKMKVLLWPGKGRKQQTTSPPFPSKGLVIPSGMDLFTHK